ncbi:golgi SNARE protein, putative [Eimeria acervulina]|uniref:Golgi SNARE protein, putative n=1 Tax=Eimeria acervulina TaxID=5801 RepID=U6G955_EIMAC|nr:golgi SNARE protein, putative [Eimeria acervulina]CDI76047.1 golgi SNARE protein, putative [Eimeria acervulina]
MEDTPSKDTLSELYPQCVSLRKELDSLLRTISSPLTLQAPVHQGCRSYGAPSGRENAAKGAGGPFGAWDGRVIGSCSVAKLQRFSALTRQFCMLVLRLQDALASSKSGGLSRNMYSMWERRIQDMVADAESFRREAEGRMNLEQQRVQEAMRDRKALLGDADSSKRWGDVRNAELMYARERDRLQESRTVLDSVLSQGWGVVGQLVSQNASLKSARRKVLDMASSAGVASTLLGAVGRRQQGDKWLVYGGMVLTLVFFFVVYRLVHHGSIFGSASMAEAENEATFS